MSALSSFGIEPMQERIQTEVQRAIQRSIKGAEYFASSGPVLGAQAAHSYQPQFALAISRPPQHHPQKKPASCRAAASRRRASTPTLDTRARFS